MSRRLKRGGIAVAAATASLLAAAPTAPAVDDVNTRSFRESVTVNGILAHERVLQRIANRNGGTRASGTQGYTESVAYVKGRLERAGYDVTEQPFQFPFYQELADPELSQLTPTAKDYAIATDFLTMTYSGSGDVTGAVVAVDVRLPPGPTPSGNTSGCEDADFAGFPAGAIALLQRGTCTFGVKALNAQEAGASAVIIFNEGNEGLPDRQGAVAGTLGAPDVTIPVIGTSFAVGQELATAPGATARVFTRTESEIRTASNVIADSDGGDADKTVVVGAHLDSVIAGPGVNDNGSGSSGILEIAEEFAETGLRPRQKLRFAFWGAEELGLLGSENYVATLGDDGLAGLYANLNFDMIGSPNYARFVYDGDGSDTPLSGPPGSAQIEDVFTRYFASQDLATVPTAFDGRSDYGPFIAVGVPAGGLFSGAEGIKTEEEVTLFGGTAGIAYDPNYHQPGDTINNLSTKSLFELGDAAAHAVFTLARTRTGLFEDGSGRRSTGGAKRSLRSQTFLGSSAQR